MVAHAGRLVALTLALFATASEVALASPPSRNPAVAMYVEQIPTASGPITASTPWNGAALSNRAQSQLAARGGADAHALAELATSPSFGAPTKTQLEAGSGTTHGSDARLVGLIVVLALATSALVLFIPRGLRGPSSAARTSARG